MNWKSLVAIVICGVLVATIFFAYGNYQYNSGKTVGYNQGEAKGVGTFTGSDARSYQQGYQAGIEAAENGTG